MGWLRRTLHECASELEQNSDRFKMAYLESQSLSNSERSQALRESSHNGVELLRILALTVRSEQDINLIPKVTSVVGAIKTGVQTEEIDSCIDSYHPPFISSSI